MSNEGTEPYIEATIYIEREERRIVCVCSYLPEDIICRAMEAIEKVGEGMRDARDRVVLRLFNIYPFNHLLFEPCKYFNFQLFI